MGDLVELRVSQLARKIVPLKELRRWNVFNTIDDNFLRNIRLAHAHGSFGFLVSTDDTVYVIGTDTNGCLGIGTTTTSSPVEIEVLCGQSIKEFLTSRTASCFALTEDGRVFAWGTNSKGQLGLGIGGTITTPKLINMADGVKISQLAVGNGHTLALTMATAEVFSWGRNIFGKLGLGNGTDRNAPCKIISNITNIKIKQISCSMSSSFALTKSGELYAWGHNGLGELGIGNFTNSNIPTKVIFDKQIKKVANGWDHTLVLTTSGEVYTCGYNNQGQLGMGNTGNLNVLTRVSADLTVFDDISCHPGLNQSSAKSMDKTFVWGEIHKGHNLSSPTELNFSNFPHPTILFKKDPQYMYKSLCASNYAEEGQTVLETLETAIGGAGTDVGFKVEGAIIKAHKSILILRSDYFACKFSECWNKQDGPIELQDIKRDTFHALLYFLYTDKLYFSDLDFDKISDLMKLASQYRETDLRKKCESILQKQIKLENVFTIYKAAEECNAQSLRDVAFNYIVTNWPEISKGDTLDKANLSGQDFLRFTKAWAEK